MADVKESALTQQSDCKWVRALDANGNSIRISKEDLAAVVGGLLEIDMSWFRGRGSSASSLHDFNDAECGTYTINSACSNRPEQAYGVLLPFVDPTYYRCQIFISSTGNFYYRTRNESESGWNSWYKVSSSKIE